MKFIAFLSLVLSYVVHAQAATIVYADSQYLSTGLDTHYTVIYLDTPNRVLRDVFGVLPTDPNQAEQQVRAILQSPDWQQKEQQIAQAYQGVIQAYSIGLKKYPAVVFDDRYVVYGTTDITLAEAKLAEFKGAQ